MARANAVSFLGDGSRVWYRRLWLRHTPPAPGYLPLVDTPPHLFYLAIGAQPMPL